MNINSHQSQTDITDRLRCMVDAAVSASGESARQISIDITGHDGLIRDIRAGKMVGLHRLEKLFLYLNLELYFGPPRPELPEPAALTYDKAEYAPVPIYNVAASAGAGRENEPAQMLNAIAFPKKWLRRNAINPTKARLIYVDGDSMEPAIKNKAMVMVKLLDDWRARLSPKRIFAFRDGNELYIKRLQMPDAHTLIAISDNADYAPMLFTKAALSQLHIIGEVVWTGHGVG